MAEPITLALVSSVVLTEGIKFLYAQAGEILRRRREKIDAAEGDPAQPNVTDRVDIELPDAFDGQLSEPKINFDALDRLGNELLETRESLSKYAEGFENVDSNDEDLLAKTDALRRLLEAVLQERITFKGEQRSPSGPVVEGHIDVDEVAGYAAAVRSTKITGGRTEAEAKAKRVEPGAEFIGVDADEIGGEKR
jgi:hypothetical protein